MPWKKGKAAEFARFSFPNSGMEPGNKIRNVRPESQAVSG
jgi:hypothetical protein